ncbi:MAG: tetratricopeptide repeat protein, partial [Planctomycetes bacterium]|nr:tetratricopeptide repeat protein [Planctomycetota bacterium]
MNRRVNVTRMVHPVALCLLAGILAGCATNTHALDKAQAQQRWNRARGGVKLQLAEQQYQFGQFEDTVQTASEALALDPSRARAYVLLARSYLELGKSGSARQTVEAARGAGLDTSDLWYTEGVLLEQSGQTDAALDKYAHARGLDPTNVDSLVAQAECLVAADRATEALALLNRERDRVDDNATSDVLAAHIAVLTGDHREAIRHYRQALVEVGPGGVIAAELGVLLTQVDRCDEALTVLRPLLERPDDVPMEGAVRRALAACYLATDNTRLAADSLAEYAEENRQDALAQLLLAKAAIANGDVITAL